jgi:1-pyrroline-5-carboxylate dehydrogenase
MKGFRNEPLTDFSKPRNRALMEKAIKKVERDLGRKYSIIIGGKKRTSRKSWDSTSPSDPGVVVGSVAKASTRQACEAVENAYARFQTWKYEKASVRAKYLLKMAAIMRKRKMELAAYMIFEEGKPWLEADADVAEAIDFCEFYAREALRYAGEQPLTKIPAEKNELRYIPLGVGVVIPPWNFPFAILVGMTTASLVAGNTVVLKPSSDSPVIAAKFMEVAMAAGLPGGVVNFLPGSGSEAGEAAVLHPKTRFIAFTGSKEVGLRIVEQAAKMVPGQIWIKRVIAEMGGKDTIVVDGDTNLDDAVDGVLRSAFGFQGQKCSACSRAIVVSSVYKKFIDKLVPKVEALKVGPPQDFGNYMGPVINKRAAENIMHYIRPTVIKDVKPHAVISQEEIFGPVLAVIKARNFDDALEIANNTEYGLTGAVYTRNRRKIDKAKRVFHVGNLYINRGCTGALVGVHPFGGFNMSGTDSKAGGRDYLLLFTQAKSISEKVRKR